MAAADFAAGRAKAVAALKSPSEAQRVAILAELTFAVTQVGSARKLWNDLAGMDAVKSTDANKQAVQEAIAAASALEANLVLLTELTSKL
jgi:hypothetical protein